MTVLATTQFFNAGRGIRLAFIGAAAVVIAGCSTVSNMFGGGDDTVILPGDREAVLDNSGELSVDPAAVAASLVIPAAQTNANWAQPGGVPSNHLTNLSMSPNPSVAWRASIGEGSSRDGRLAAPPIVVAGSVFTIDAYASVSAFNARSGDRLWSTSLVPGNEGRRGGFGGGLASDGTMIYVATGFGEIVALDPRNGSISWRERFNAPFRAAPTVTDGKIYAMSVNNTMIAVSTTDGSRVWDYEGIGEQTTAIDATSPAIANNFVIAPYTSGEIMAFQSSDGIPIWQDSLSSLAALSSAAAINNIAGRPVIADGHVYAVSNSGRMGAFDLRSGARVWTRDIPGRSTPWVAGDFLFVVVNGDALVAVSRRNGGVRWTSVLPGGQRWIGPVMGNGRLIVASSEGSLIFASPQDGEILEQKNVGGKFFVPPVIADGTLYLLSDNGTLYAMR